MFSSNIQRFCSLGFLLAISPIYFIFIDPLYLNAKASSVACSYLTDSERSRGRQFDPLVLPIVIHLHRSERWTSPDRVKGVMAESQRILSQAGIELLPTFSDRDVATQFLDIYFLPDVRVNGQRVNGVSYAWGEREVFVRDNVSLRSVDDCRPNSPLPLPLLWPMEGSPEFVEVSLEEAEQARTLVHEIAHQLDLQHREDETNLLASGTTGWQLSRSEILTIRESAVKEFRAFIFLE